MTPALRQKILRRDKFICQLCGHQPPDVKLHIDHRLPRSKGGTDDPENLWVLCADCNIGKNAKYNDCDILFFLILNWHGDVKAQLLCRRKDFEKNPSQVEVQYYSLCDGMPSALQILDFTKGVRYEKFDDPKKWRARWCEITWRKHPEFRMSNRDLKSLIKENERIAQRDHGEYPANDL